MKNHTVIAGVRRSKQRLFLSALIALAGAFTAAADAPRVLRIAYFIPSDRQPCADYTNRLDAVVKEIQAFYRKGMEANGHGPLSFIPDRTPDGGLRFRVVRGQRPMRDYGRNDAGKVRQEVKEAFSKDGLDMDRETVLLFQVLLDWRDGKAVEVGPYCGGGDQRHGTAWVYDDERLDPRRMADPSPGGYYGGPCSIGKFNSHYVGGAAHELGHAFGLPHDREARNDPRGHSLMGGGNHTYGRDTRGEGKGSFLSAASALPLAAHPLFAGHGEAGAAPCSSKLIDLNADFQGGSLILTGRLQAQPEAYGVAAYNDSAQVSADYDALGLASALDGQGRFRFAINELSQGDWELRLRVCHAGGGSSRLSFAYGVDAQNRPDLSAFRERWQLNEAVQARARGDLQAAADLVSKLEASGSLSPKIRRPAAHLRELFHPAPAKRLCDLPASSRTVSVAELAFAEARTGWGAPYRNEVAPEQGKSSLIEIDGQFFSRGLYAHAPARHRLDLAKGWARLRGRMGLQDGHKGSVVFVVKGDGRELFRSPRVEARKLLSLDVDVKGVSSLELLTENAGDGNNGDWAVWAEPELTR